jgi:hypothetical protein
LRLRGAVVGNCGGGYIVDGWRWQEGLTSAKNKKKVVATESSRATAVRRWALFVLKSSIDWRR